MSTKISGVLIENGSNKPLSGLYIELFNDNQTVWLGGDKSDINGQFSFYTREDVPGWSYPLYMVVYRNDIPYHTVEIQEWQESYLITLSALNERAGDPTHEAQDADRDHFTVNGTVKSTSAQPVPSATVRIYAAGFRENILIGKTETDFNGRYSIKVARASLNTENTKESRSILLEARDSGGNVFAASKKIFDIPLKLEVNLDAHEDPEELLPEFVRVQTLLQQAIGETEIAEITTEGEERESSYLSRITGLDETIIKHMVKSHVLAGEASVPESIVAPDMVFAVAGSAGVDVNPLLSKKVSELETIIRGAMDTGAIGTKTNEEINVFKAQIRAFQVVKTKETPVRGESFTLQEVFDSFFTTENDTNDFLAKFHEQDYVSTPAFWDVYETQYGATKSKNAQMGLKLAGITGFQPEIIAGLMTDIEILGGLHELATLSEADWYSKVHHACLIAQRLCVPSAIRGEETDPDNTEIKIAYARKLKDIIQDFFPLTALKTSMANASEDILIPDPDIRSQVITFINNNPSFDLRRLSVYDINGEDWDLSDGENTLDAEDLKMGLEPFQRLLRITGGKPEAVIAMKLNGLDSSEAINNMDEDVFIDTYADLLGGIPGALAALKKANINGAIISNVLTDIGALNGGLLPFVFGDKRPIDPVAEPDLATMFGSLDFCSCAHCLSMYSPAAYFTDIMHFLRQKSGTKTITDITAYNELIRRRPDLEHIDLTCKNTNTAIPYVDLINELMELETLKRNGQNPPDSFQTSGEARVLSAHPEHVYKDGNGDYQDYGNYNYVYDTVLSNAVYPFNLPFNFALESTRTYLKHLGMNRFELMKIFRPATPVAEQTSGVTSNDITSYNGLAEFLGLSKRAADIIIKAAGYANPWEYYGFGSSNVSNYPSPTDSSLLLGGNWYDLLSGNVAGQEGGVDVLIQQLNVSYKELLQLLTTDFLNLKVPDGSGNYKRRVTIEARSGKPADTCILQYLRLKVSNLPAGVTQAEYLTMFFDKLHRFIRLWKATGLTIYTLDMLLSAVCTKTATDYTVNGEDFFGDLTISTFKLTARSLYISSAYGITPESLITWWSDISTTRYTDYNSESLDEIPSVYDKLFRNKTVNNLPASQYQNPFNTVPSGTTDLSLHTAIIAAVFSIKEEEVIAIMNYLFGGPPTGTGTPLADLSSTYFVAALAKSSGLSVKDLITLLQLLPEDLKSATSIDDTYNVIESLSNTLQLLGRSGFTLQEADYLVRNIDATGSVAPDPATVQQFYEGLRRELQKFSEYDGNTSSDLFYKLKNIVTQHYSKEFNLPSAWISLMLTDASVPGNAPVVDLSVEDLMDTTFVTSIIDLVLTTAAITAIPALPDMYNAYRRIYKIALIVARLQLKHQEFEDLYSRQSLTDFHYVDLPDSGDYVTPSSNIPFAGLLRLMALKETSGILNLKESELGIFLDAANGTGSAGKGKWLDIVRANTGWGDTLDLLIGAAGTTTATGLLSMQYDSPGSHYATTDIQNIRRIGTIADIIAWTDRSGLKPGHIRNVLLANLVMNDAQKVLEAAKAKHSDPEWLKIAKPLRDVLREQQRQALVRYMVANPQSEKWRNEHELYAHFLIDVEMSPCMMTSRLKQGISSVQMFMDRLIMGLEYYNYDNSKHLGFEDKDTRQWKLWRKWYRIWEANRKVFFYPENWIEPDLRDDKSVFFEEFETELLQDEVTPELVEDTIRNYLLKLDEVGRLEPVGIYHQNEDGIVVTHAFARTYADPHTHYYRRLVNEEWTPWERVEIDIKSEHVVPYMINNKLYLFWLTFKEKQVNLGEIQPKDIWWGKNILDINNINYWFYNKTDRTLDDKNDGGGEKQTIIEVTLNWSEYKKGKWRKHKVSKDNMQFFINPNLWFHIHGFTYSNPQTRQYISSLNKNFELNLAELIKRRMFLRAAPDGNSKLFLSILFSSNSPEEFEDENAKFMQTFQFDQNKDESEVIRFWYPFWNQQAISHTVFEDMRFRENGITPQGWAQDCPLQIDTYTLNNSVAYNHINERTEPVQILQRTNATSILNSTAPNGIFRVVTKSNYEINPLEDQFMFYDNTNTYFVRLVLNGFEFRDMVTTADEVNLSLSGTLGEIIYKEPSGLGFGPLNLTPTSQTTSPFSGGPIATAQTPTEQYLFQTFYHPHVHKFIKALNREGVDGLLKLSMQDQSDEMNFNTNYQPTLLVYGLHPTSKVGFDYFDTYACYNWELFFHIPMMIAQKLSENQQFDAAQKWFHYIFDPTCSTASDGVTPSTDKKRFWNFWPFHDKASQPVQTLNDILILINQKNKEYQAQVTLWEDNPFKPHLIARMRMLAYMKNVVMKYLDNLIAWGDQLFRRDTIESINEATQLYILAANILGVRPREVPARAKTSPKSFGQLLSSGLDALSNAKVKIESYLDPNSGFTGPVKGGPAFGPKTVVPSMFYFCLNNNEKLAGYWDTIADRLFKIRNCRNIEGQERQLPLFEPPIDPALLVKAAAAGIDISSVLDDVSAGIPVYRFNYVAQKASELCNDVKALGNSLLSALEKKDAEELALLRSGQELSLLEKIRMVKQSQVDEATASLEGLEISKENIQKRMQYYASRPFMNAKEKESQRNQEAAAVLQAISGNLSALGSVLSGLPQFHLQALASGISLGGQQLSAVMSGISQATGVNASIASAKGNMAATNAGYERRMDDWKFQAESAQLELQQVDKQIIAAQIRLAITEKELDNHELQMENAAATDEFMRSKFTNKQLYTWMLSQLSATYFQSYQLAYDLARKAEACYAYELPLSKKASGGFVKFGYWDSLKKGLLAGEKLQYDIRKMEIAYMEDNKRELELTKHVSLVMLDAEQLLQLRKKGTCSFSIPEELYDLEYPGHYNRRMKSVSISIPCIAGPYTTIPCKLELTSSKIRKKPFDTAATSITNVPVSAIATSTAQNDSGMFEFNFRDERYLPFEGGGAISTWEITLGGLNTKEGTVDIAFRPFDFNTISDVILHVKYTATDGSAESNGTVEFGAKRASDVYGLIKLGTVFSGKALPRYFSLKHEFFNDWYAYSRAVEHNESAPKLTLRLSHDRYPYLCKDRTISISKVYVQARFKAGQTGSYKIEHADSTTDILLNISDGTPEKCQSGVTIPAITTMGTGSTVDVALRIYKDVAGSWEEVQVEDVFEDIYLVTYYKLS